MFEVEPYVSVGPVSFGASPEEVVAALGREPEDTVRGEERVDHVLDGRLLVHYDERTGGVSFVEATPEGGGLRVGDLEVRTAVEVDEVRRALRDAGIEVHERSPDLLTLPALGLAIWTEDGERVETVGAFDAPDYYDR